MCFLRKNVKIRLFNRKYLLFIDNNIYLLFKILTNFNKNHEFSSVKTEKRNDLNKT